MRDEGNRGQAGLQSQPATRCARAPVFPRDAASRDQPRATGRIGNTPTTIGEIGSSDSS